MKTTIISIIALVVVVGGLWIFRFRNEQSTEIVSPSQAPATSLAPSSTPTATPTLTPKATPSTVSGTFSAAQVAAHNSQSSCYSIIGGSVYDLTTYIPKHPGGSREILDICGKDGSALFEAQHGGSAKQANILATLKIGTLGQ